MTVPKMSSVMRRALFYVRDNETPAYGVIILYSTGEWAIKRGFVTSAQRRSYTRQTGLCVRLTDKGREILNEIEGKE